MRSEEELRQFLRTDLRAQIERWKEASRTPPLPRNTIALGIGALALSVLLRSLAPLTLALLLWGGRALGRLGRLLRAQRAFKEDVLRRLVAFLEPGLAYEPSGCIPAALVRAGGLFQESWDSAGGEDYFEGRVGATQLRFSELRLSRRKNKNETETVFRGLYVVADFSKSFRGRTVLLPDRAERALGALGRAFQQVPPLAGMELVQLEDPAFERLFVCYATDPVEARYLLSPSFVQRLARFRENTGAALRIGFANDSLHLAMPLEQDLFAVPMTPEAFDEELVRRHVGELLLVTGIVEDLDLDTRIWSKAAPAA